MMMVVNENDEHDDGPDDYDHGSDDGGVHCHHHVHCHYHFQHHVHHHHHLHHYHVHHHHHHHLHHHVPLIKTVAPFFFHTRFKSAVRPDWKCRGCVVMIVMMTAGDAEDV